LGNGFLTGARDLFGSLPSAIFLFKSIAGVAPSVQVIPVINTNQSVIIAAQLVNGDTLVGQCNISHPTVEPTTSGLGRQRSVLRHSRPNGPGPHFRRDSRTFDTADSPSPLVSSNGKPWDPTRSPSIEEEEGGNISYTKGQGEIPLEARIERIFYINLYGQVCLGLPHDMGFADGRRRSSRIPIRIIWNHWLNATYLSTPADRSLQA
jgi:hypothetical protein